MTKPDIFNTLSLFSCHGLEIILVWTVIIFGKSKQCQSIEVYVLLTVGIVSLQFITSPMAPSVVSCYPMTKIRATYYLYVDFHAGPL